MLKRQSLAGAEPKTRTDSGGKHSEVRAGSKFKSALMSQCRSVSAVLTAGWVEKEAYLHDGRCARQVLLVACAPENLQRFITMTFHSASASRPSSSSSGATMRAKGAPLPGRSAHRRRRRR